MTIQISHTVDGIACDSCGDEYPGSKIVQHLKDAHGYNRDDLKPYALQIDVNIDEVLCDHPNGFGVNGCAGCGFSPDNVKTPDLLRRIRSAAGVLEGLRRKSDISATFAFPTSPLQSPSAEEETTEDALNGEDELTEWWLQRANEEAEAVIPKAVAYGSNSLMQLGRKMAQLQGREVDDAEAMELGCWVNAIQKVERWTDAVMRGERCSDDTIYDAGIYVKMVQRIRDVGSWPGV